jgi:hypothetical protein
LHRSWRADLTSAETTNPAARGSERGEDAGGG